MKYSIKIYTNSYKTKIRRDVYREEDYLYIDNLYVYVSSDYNLEGCKHWNNKIYWNHGFEDTNI